MTSIAFVVPRIPPVVCKLKPQSTTRPNASAISIFLAIPHEKAINPTEKLSQLNLFLD